MNNSTLTLDEIKQIIKTGIEEQIDFKELRNRLKGVYKKPLVALIYDMMAEMNIKDVPFPGLLSRPQFARKPVPISENGDLNVAEILREKGFTVNNCEAFPFVGKKKITITIKPCKKANKKSSD